MMPRQFIAESRTGARYLAALPVRAEWDDAARGVTVTEEGTTENVGPEGVLVHLQRQLPDVGSRVRLEVQSEEGHTLHVVTEVLRLERNAAHPQAALQLLDAHDEWRGMVWEPAAPRAARPDDDGEDDEADFDDDEISH